jgi:hypothetical protein
MQLFWEIWWFPSVGSSLLEYSNENWVRRSFWCLEYIVHLYLRWTVGCVSLGACFSLIGSGSVDVRIYYPSRTHTNTTTNFMDPTTTVQPHMTT